jgi:hypothetical protein
MAAPNEPENGSYVAVLMGVVVSVFRRDDRLGQDAGNDYNWVLVSGREDRFDASPRSWAEVCSYGPVAYVGAFIDRRVKEAA